ncbi:hypothetical protein TYRP_010838 [Tyrophagus putrescentiae]|nr:hypothetical protein TYRP_010838 [Tyrophagus putrescentiae]
MAVFASFNYFLIILNLVLLSTRVTGQNWLIGSFIPSDYDKSQPPLVNGYVPVDSTVVINRFSAASDQRSLNVDILLCSNWHDPRLVNINPITYNESGRVETFRYASVRSTNYSIFWLPQVYIRNGMAYSVIESIRNLEYIEVWPETKMLQLCRRLNVQLFPFDAQECYIELQSAGNTIQHLQMTMSSVIAKTGGNNQLRLHHTWNGSCTHPNPDHLTAIPTAQYDSCAFAGIRFVRHLSYYIIRYYTSTFLCICTSFASFWVATCGWPARVILTLVVYLTVKAISQTAYDEVPVPDVCPLFWWLWVIQFLNYMNLVEYATALAWVQFADEKNRARAQNRPSEDGDPPGRNKVDYTARLFMPAVFFLFVFVYIVATIPAWAVKYL